ncbi:unnamed protein product (macronuclear) [Paramecium tetraurelia]|uniref:Myb-like DNA-binding domain containing protein n=1 Tax=Paramecium tetraurelia TaxID=5888 RepID=A0DMF4_PARTE|nr:uncharacterized protein GSPATT00018439001 [Paramecium tetraurelia]CAK84221.1 unnamed protein product [Paramecium tetraurelia]|eukprot:XP_001451618.1 hypothetical protein (macronuclear) [Paramecium tetraurelia strain d4-2]
MSFSESNDFQNEEYRFEEVDDFIDFEDLAYNDVMRYEGELGKYELFKAFDSVDKEKERELVEENQSEMQKISSTLCMREEEVSDESEDESQFQGTQSRTCNSGTLQKSIRKRNRGKEEPKRKIKKWSEEENRRLEDLFQIYKGDWEIIVRFLEGRTVSQCKQHWQRLSGGQEKKKKWTEEENQIILSFTKENPQFNNWALIAARMQGRNGKQIREHYMNQLRPGIKNKQGWNEEEDKQLLNLYQRYGSKWCQINKHFEGRTEIMLKNRFNKLQKGNTYIDHFLNIDDEPQQQQQSHTFSFN